jgi:hypothetical protein
MENVNQQEPEVELTAEELAVRKEEMLKFYTESLPYLKAQAEYEKTLCEIDEARFKRTTIQYQYAMFMQQQEEQPEGADNDIDNSPEIPEQGRKLKKQ